MDSELQDTPVVDRPTDVPWGRAPLFWVAPRLFASQILSLAPLKRYEGTACRFTLKLTLAGVRLLNGHPVRQAEILGMLTWVYFHAEKDKYRFHIDDGTGVVLCHLFSNVAPTFDLHPGTIVHVRGKLYVTKDAISEIENVGITVYSIRPVSDPNEEMLYWAEVMHQRRFVNAEPKITV